jgi:hypothetical protein
MKKRSGLYHSLIVLPDTVFPFKTEVGGQWVRGIRSYNARLARYQRQYGPGRYGFKLNAYRQFFHFVGSILFLVIAAYLSQLYFGGTQAMVTFLSAAVGLISFQEFYLHRRMYQQLWRKGIVDWLSWCIPFGIYFFTHFR